MCVTIIIIPTYTLISDTVETLHCTKYTCYYTTPLDDDPMEVWVSGVWPLALEGWSAAAESATVKTADRSGWSWRQAVWIPSLSLVWGILPHAATR